MRCIKCEGKLLPVRVDDVDVDQCDTCGGIWFDAHELERVLRQSSIDPLLGRPARSGDDARRGRCPRCKSEGYLVQVASGKSARVHVDTCAVCGGKWLDGGELDVLHRDGLSGKVRRFLDFILDLDLP